MQVIKLTCDKIIEPSPLEDINYRLDPYIGCEYNCRYCYAQNSSVVDWENEIGVYPQIERKLIEKLSFLPPQTIYIGANTDPYQPFEKGLQQTRTTLEFLRKRDFSACILTKSDLVTRDIDLLKSMPDASVGTSIAFLDDSMRRMFEMNTIPNKDRIQALAKLKEEGIETYAMIAPVMPYVTEVEVLIDIVRPYADTIWVYPLEMNSEEDKNWQKIQRVLEGHFPDTLRQLKEVVFQKDHIYWKELSDQLENIKKRDKIDLRIHI
jgi:DNA repair photolyase